MPQVIYATEGGSFVNYTLEISPDVAYPTELAVVLPEGARQQGQIALYAPETDTYSSTGDVILLPVLSAADAVVHLGFQAYDDSIAEGVHFTNIEHTLRYGFDEYGTTVVSELGSVRVQIADANSYQAGITVLVSTVYVLEGNGTVMVPIILNAPSDQEVVVTITSDLGDRLDLPNLTVTFPPGETGPLVFPIEAPDNGKPLPDVSGTLTITTNSVSDIYDNLVDVIDVTVMEDRDVGIRVTPSYVEVLSRNNNAADFYLQLTSASTAMVVIELKADDDNERVAFSTPTVTVMPGAASTGPILVTAYGLTSFFTGTVSATATVTRTADVAYFGQSASFTIFVDNSQGEPPEILLRLAPVELIEGSYVTWEVAIATPPSEMVTVTLVDRWPEGFIHDVTINPSELTFMPGEAMRWQLVKVSLPNDNVRLGKSMISIIHSARSKDISYDSTNDLGAKSKVVTFPVSDDEKVGVCLGKCEPATKYDFYFDKSGGWGFSGPLAVDEGPPGITVFETPYEVQAGEVTLPFMLQAVPRGQVTIDFQVSLPGGLAEIAISSEMQARRRKSADGGLIFDPFNFKTPADVIIKAVTSDTSVVEHRVFITGTVVSDDADYSGIKFTFSIYVAPQLTGTARIVPIQPVLPTVIDIEGGIEIVIPPLTLPIDTEITVAPVPVTELNCSAFSTTRFNPFGFKELSASLVEAGHLPSPVRVYWRIPSRFQSLKQIKFVYSPAKDNCNWELFKEIGLEIRENPSLARNLGTEEFYAYIDVATFGIWGLVHVLPLVEEVPLSTVMYKEDDPPMPVLPGLELKIKRRHSWLETYDNLRISHMNISLSGDFEQPLELGNDALSLPSIPGFASQWLPTDRILMVSAIPGFLFTENAADDYEDGVVETVNINQFIDSVEATATLGAFSSALRDLRFQSSGPAGIRTLQLSVQELLTMDVVSLIAEVQVLFSPDPPVVIPSPVEKQVTEKAPYTKLDPEIQVIHPDLKQIRGGKIWMGPRSETDVIIYQPDPSAEPSAPLTTKLDPLTRGWTISGLSTPEEYARVFQNFVFKNDGPVVHVDGELQRIVYFEVTDEEGRVGTGQKNITMIPVNDPPVVFDISFTVLEGGSFVGVLEGYDPEGEKITFSAGCPPERGNVEVSSEPSLSSATFNFTSYPQSAGRTTFIVTVSDGELEGYGLVTVNILNANDPPVAEDLVITVYSGRTTNFSLPAYDPDGNPVELYILTEPQSRSGIITLSSEIIVSSGGLRRKGLNPVTFYAPDEVIPDYGVTFSYIARDPIGNLKSREAWAYMLVRSPVYWSDILQNTSPVAFDSALQTLQGSRVQGTLNATDEYDTPEQMVFTVLESSSNGEVTLQGNAFDYVPNPGFHGEDSFMFQATDGMGLASNNATVKITVLQNNEPPHLACENGSSGLFLSYDLLATLKAVSQGEATATNVTIGLLLEESETSAASDQFPRSLRTQALQRVAELASDGAIVFGPSASTLACSATSTTRIRMASDVSTESLDVALLAFDIDEEIGTIYTLLDVPPMGDLYATSALPGAIYPQASDRLFLEIGGAFRLAGSVDNTTASYEVPHAGQPLFLHYKPEKLTRGQPAAVISWVASDWYGKKSEVSRISIDILCDPGHAIAAEDSATCAPCQRGQYNLPELLDQVQCLPCPIGSFCDQIAATSFQACPPGSYQDSPGAAACTQCDDEAMASPVGATSRRECTCPRGTYVLNWGQSPESCIQCRPDQQLCDEDHQRVPKPATVGVWIDPETGESVSCEPYASCIKHTTVEGALSGECSEGYMGWGCSECAASFYRSEDTTCSRCNNYVWILYIIAFLGSLVLVPTLLKISKSQGFMSVNILIGTLQMATAIQQLELEWPEFIRSFFAVLNVFSLSLSALSPRCVVSDWQYLNKVPIMNAVPPGVFVFLVAHEYFLPRIRYVVQVVWARLFGSRSKAKPNRFRRHSAEYYAIMGPVAEAWTAEGPVAEAWATPGPVAESWVSSASCRKLRQLFRTKSLDELQPKSLMECVRTVTPAMLVVLSWSYVLLANINMEFFSCYKRDGKWYLAAEPSVQCYDFDTYGQHAQLLPLGIAAMAIYVLGIPLLFAGLLYRHRKILRHRQGLEEMLRQKNLAVKRQQSKHKLELKKLATRTGYEQMSVVQKLDLDLPEAILTDAKAYYGFLFRHYEERGFWWELVVLARKALVAVIIHLPKAPEQQTMLGILVLLGYISLTHQQQPYTATYLNTMDTVGTAMATGLALAGLVMFGGYDTGLDTYTASVIQITLIMIMVTFLVAFVIYDGIPKVKLHFRLKRQKKRVARLRSARTSSLAASTRSVVVSTAGGVSHIRSRFFFSKMDADDSSDEEDGAAAVHPAAKDDQDWNSFGVFNRSLGKDKGRSSAEGSSYRLDSRKAKSARVRFPSSIMYLESQRTKSSRGPASRALKKSLDGQASSVPSSSRGHPSRALMKSLDGQASEPISTHGHPSLAFSNSLNSLGSVLSRHGTAGKLSMTDEAAQQFSAREIRSFEENVVILRCATAIVFPPKRRQCVSKMKDFFEPAEFHQLFRWVLSPKRTQEELDEAYWTLDTLERVGSEPGFQTEEQTIVSGIHTLAGKLKGAGSNARSHRRSSAGDNWEAGGIHSHSVKAFDASEESRHVAELFEIAGAPEISPAIRLQVAAMRCGPGVKLGKILAKAQEQEEATAAEQKKKEAVNFTTLTAAAKFKNNLRKAKEKQQNSAVSIVANLLFGELSGPKAGPLRWVFQRKLLLDIWEWNSFRACPWMRSVLARLGERAAEEFPDDKVAQWMEAAAERAEREHKRAKITAGSARAKLKGLSQKIRKGAQRIADTTSRKGMSDLSIPSAHAILGFEGSSFSREELRTDEASLDTVGLKEVDPCHTSSSSVSPKPLLGLGKRPTIGLEEVADPCQTSGNSFSPKALLGFGER